MAAMYTLLSLRKALKNVVLFTRPIDFVPDDPGLFGLWSVLTS